MYKLLFRLAVVGLWITTGVPQALAGKRVALVIGNDAYAQVPKLQKAVNDAGAMAETLAGIGFKVLRGKNLSRRDMNRQIQLFASQLEAGDEALFFFAGHGVEINGRNYLLPTDVPTATPGQEGFVTSEAIAVDRVLDRIRERGPRVSILVLDACRDNPFPKSGTRSVGGTRGLARMPAPEGTFIMYSAGVGQTALDRLADNDPHSNSVFTRSLIPLLKSPGLSLTETARRVRRDVQALARTISHDQRPAYYDEVTGNFFFAGRGDAREVNPPKRPTGGLIPANQAWNTIKDTKRAGDLEVFIKRFPESFFADLARSRLNELKRQDQAALLSRTRPEQRSKPPVLNKEKSAVELNALAESYYRRKDYAEAIRLARLAADKKHPKAMYRLGVIYESGHGIQRDGRLAAGWYRKAAEKGVAQAANRLAYLYGNGKGVTQNGKEAVHWYRKAARLGHVGAMKSLGHIYSFGKHQPVPGIDADYEEARRWYLRAADEGDSNAMNSLGVMYESNFRNAAEAVNWYQKAVNNGETFANINLGRMYEQGTGVSRDYYEAAKLYRVAVDNGHARAFAPLALMYDKGRGVARDAAEAAKYLIEAFKRLYDRERKQLAERSLEWTISTRRAVQERLRQEGVYAGSVDGRFGPETKRAIEAVAKK